MGEKGTSDFVPDVDDDASDGIEIGGGSLLLSPKTQMAIGHVTL